ncbi:ATP-binding protein [Methylovulum miyakonense]|uniref:ATP-binding protein n=1 Tax=Methylovulum miyakonense TaxID=645578 RepID=UPI00037BF6C2|nr:ATP-binding protein [Methylovulum miyakonense]
MSSKRPCDLDIHPISQQTYRIATPAIVGCYALLQECLRYRIPGALIYGRPRLGKTYAIDYLRLLLKRDAPEIASFHIQSQHKVGHSEGGFFAHMLRATGYPEPDQGRNSVKRARLTARLREAALAHRSNRLVMLCDEAQRYSYNEYEWLRDIHDELALLGIRLHTLLVGQPQLLHQKNAFQLRGDEQIVARFMIEEFKFYGIRSAEETATCLNGYDQTEYPEKSGWTFTRFFYPDAYEAGLRLTESAHLVWNAFAELHHQAALPGPLEIPMEYFSRAVESALLETAHLDAADFKPNPDLWRFAVKRCGYLKAQRAAENNVKGG